MREADYLEFSSDDDEADYAASQQQASASFVRCDSASCADGDVPWEIIYSKENVAIHPSQFASERICGRLRVSKHGSSLFLSWIPYTLDPDASESLWHMSFSRIQEKDRDLYTIKSLPLSDVRSIRRHSPVLGWHYVIIVLSTGLAFPPFYFYNGGVHEFLATLKQHIVIVRSADDENVFLVNDIRDPLQVSLSSLELPRVVSVANSSSFTNEVMIPSVDCARVNGNGTQHDGSSIASDYYRWQNQKNSDPFHGISFQLLEKFSLVTKFARETTSNIFHEFHNNKADAYGKRQQNNHGTLSSSGSFSDEEERNQGATPVASDPLVPDQLPVIWGQPRKPPLSSEEWETFLDSEGRVLDSKSLKEGIFYGGIEHSLRKEVWKFLLGYYQYDSTYAEREYLSSIKKTEYEVIKSQWKSISAAQAKRYTKFRERKGLIDKDVVRTDRSISFYEGDDNQNVTIMHDILLTYSFYNFDLGYCQGMSDLLSPILYVMKDESESFWCFVALMERLGPNFNRDQSGMHSQLFAVCKLVELLDNPLHCYFERVDCLNYFFCFRWLLIQFKREFEYGKILYLWEVLWTHHLSEHFHLYVCVAILKRYRNKIMDEQMDFDTLLKFINELSGKIDLDRILRYAEVLCDRAGEHGAACIPPGTPPTLLNEGDTSIFQLEDEVL